MNISDTPIDIKSKFEQIDSYWSPGIIARMNDYHFKLAKFKGEFTWHSHEETDEVFIVIAGEMVIEMRDRSITLKEGDLYVVPKGVWHKPVAEDECRIMLVEPAGTVNTGGSGGGLTAPADKWLD